MAGVLYEPSRKKKLKNNISICALSNFTGGGQTGTAILITELTTQEMRNMF